MKKRNLIILNISLIFLLDTDHSLQVCGWFSWSQEFCEGSCWMLHLHRSWFPQLFLHFSIKDIFLCYVWCWLNLQCIPHLCCCKQQFPYQSGQGRRHRRFLLFLRWPHIEEICGGFTRLLHHGHLQYFLPFSLWSLDIWFKRFKIDLQKILFGKCKDNTSS